MTYTIAQPDVNRYMALPALDELARRARIGKEQFAVLAVVAEKSGRASEPRQLSELLMRLAGAYNAGDITLRKGAGEVLVDFKVSLDTIATATVVER